MNRGLKRIVTVSGAFVLFGGAFAAGCSSTPAAMDASTGTDSGTTSDTSASDTAMDTKFKDMNTPDNQPMCPTPEMLSSFMPPMFVNPAAVQNVCTTGNQGQIQGYWDNCRAPQATMQGCQTWKSNNATCVACLETKRADNTWGPLVVGNGITFLNVSGCLQLQAETQCANDYQALEFCSFAACDKRCPVTDFFQPDHAQTLMDWDTCSQTAEMSGSCSMLATKVNQSCASDKKCTPAGLNLMSFQDGYFIYGPMFCSGGG